MSKSRTTLDRSSQKTPKIPLREQLGHPQPEGTLSKKFSFPKKERLKSKKLIEQLFEDGKSSTVFPIKLIHLNTQFSDGSKTKAMVIVPKKNFKSAVKRNRIKRLLREAYRLNKHTFFNNIEGNFAFAILYLGKEMPTYQMIEERLIALFDRFIKKSTHEQED